MKKHLGLLPLLLLFLQSAHAQELGPDEGRNGQTVTTTKAAPRAIVVGSKGITTPANTGLNLNSGGNGVNLQSSGLNGGGLNQAGKQFYISPQANNGSSINGFLYTGAADLTLPASTEIIANFWNNAAAPRGHGTGALALQRDFVVNGATDNFNGASTLTDGATFGFALKNCGTNGTCTNESGLFHASTLLTGSILNSYVINAAADTGATNNYVANLSGSVIMANTGAVTAGTNGAACFSTSGQLGANASNCIPSLLKFKQDVAPLAREDAVSEVNKLAGDAISYRLTDDYIAKDNLQYHSSDRQVGFGAEWIERDDPRLAEYNSEDKLQGVRYEQITAIEAVAISQLSTQVFWLKIGMGLCGALSLVSITKRPRTV